MKIKLLPADVVSMIAAGEVITRPADVVKQLVENSIDAGAKRISVTIQAGGSELIRVVDDGAGIGNDDLTLALASHSTSKLTVASDLQTIGTLGFRGEALASIAAVAETTIFSRADGTSNGAVVQASAGEITDVRPHGGPAGTSVSVRNLYFNTPARRRFLKSRGAEAGRVNQLIGHMALAYPEIQFSLNNDARTVLKTPGSGRLLDAVRVVTGVNDPEKLIEISDEDGGGLSVTGYVSGADTHHATRQNQVIQVNRRLIQNRSLSYGLEDAYQPALPTGRHPLAVLDIRVPFDQVDVNIHPAKTEVRFSNERGVYSFVRRAIRTTLMRESPWPTYSGEADRAASARGRVAAGIEFGRLVGQPTSGGTNDSEIDIFTADLVQRRAPAPDGTVLEADGSGVLKPEDSAERPNVHSEPVRPGSLRSLGQIDDNTYIVAEGPDGVYFIDQHAAHERVLYEVIETRRQSTGPSLQPSLQPIPLELSSIQQQTLRDSENVLKANGFDVEEFGPGSWVLRAVPAGIPDSRLTQAALEAIDGLGSERTMPDGRWRISATIACHSAVRAGDRLTAQEINKLLSLLEATDVSRYCPHGRPIIIHLPASRLARDFGRR